MKYKVMVFFATRPAGEICERTQEPQQRTRQAEQVGKCHVQNYLNLVIQVYKYLLMLYHHRYDL
jgi:hypothetical protein